MVSCEIPVSKSFGDLTLGDYSSLKAVEYVVDSKDLRETICHKFDADTELDKFLNNYYADGKPLVWVTREGLNPSIDTLLSYVSQIDSIGFDKECFNVSQIERDAKRLKRMKVSKEHPLGEILARLESNLSKTYLRYVAGMRFGFVNPAYVFNYHEAVRDGKPKKVYDHKFEMDIIRPDSAFYSEAMARADASDIAALIEESKPADPLYLYLQDKLNQTAKNDTVHRGKYLANMERLRWKMKDSYEQNPKYVLVNIPSFRLWGVGGDTVLTMKVVCGAVRTKSPLLTSKIKRIDLNPQWHVPHSISSKSLAHAGPGYFARNNMFFVDRSGRVLKYASPDMRRRGLVSIVQRGGSHNSLGRIIFRFDNPFSVYLHHTNTPWAFQASSRAMSHGCIRLERPLDLANFLMSDPSVQEKIAYSFSCDLSHPDSSKFIRQVAVSPEIPVYIVYQTIFSVPGSDEIIELDDIYGYDKMLVKNLMPLMNSRLRQQLTAKPDEKKSEKKEAKSAESKQKETTPAADRQKETNSSDVKQKEAKPNENKQNEHKQGENKPNTSSHVHTSKPSSEGVTKSTNHKNASTERDGNTSTTH